MRAKNKNAMKCSVFGNWTCIIRLRAALGLPEKVVGYNNTTASGLEALCILLRRLAYPNRLTDSISPIFGRAKELSIIFNATLTHIHDHFGHLLTTLNQDWLSPQHLAQYARVVNDKGGPSINCWGFIEGTERPICRPSIYQRECFSGHKRVHCLKFQSVQVPNGLIAHMFPLLEGRRHDAAMLAESGLLPQKIQWMTMATHMATHILCMVTLHIRFAHRLSDLSASDTVGTGFQ